MEFRVVVTGMGLLSPLGSSVDEFWTRLLAGESGIRPHPETEIRHPVGWVEFDSTAHFSRMELSTLDRVSQFALAAARQALAQAGLDIRGALGEDAGVYFGCGQGGAETVEHAYAKYFNASANGGGGKRKLLTIPAAMVHAPASQIALRHGVRGECQTFSTACSSAAVAIGEAYLRIRHGRSNLALAGGADCVLTPGILKCWSDMGVLCRDPHDRSGSGCRPFSEDRTGFAIGEGAAVLVLERLEHALGRKAAPLVEITGYGTSNDASHLTNPDSSGQVLAMQRTLSDAGLEADDIGHINAHGTATVLGDAAEARSIEAIFGTSTPVSATKSSHGHLMGATGGIELIATALSVRHGVAPPTAHWARRDPDIGIDIVGPLPRSLPHLTHALSNSFAFGGNNVCLVVSRWD